MKRHSLMWILALVCMLCAACSSAPAGSGPSSGPAQEAPAAAAQGGISGAAADAGGTIEADDAAAVSGADEMAVLAGTADMETAAAAGEAGAGTAADAVEIGLALYGTENDYMVRLAEAASQYAQEKGIRLTVYTGDYDASTQLDQIEAMIRRGLDGIILVPQSEESSRACVDRAVEAGIPIISVNTRVDHEGLAASVGSDDREVGRLLMDEAARALGGTGEIAILEGPVGQSAQIDRRAGIRKALQPYAGIHVLSCKTANWSTLEARILVEKWLDTFERLDAVIAESDSMALGAAAVCRERGRDDILIFGTDGSPAALEAVARGEMRMTVFQNAREQARTALDVICAAVAGEAVESEYWIPLEVVTADNVQEFLERE